MSTEPEAADTIYLKLKGAREWLCSASLLVPPWWQNNVTAAVGLIDEIGSSLCASQWSRFDQPEYPTVEDTP